VSIDPRYLIRTHYLVPIRANIRTEPPRPSTLPADFERAWQVFVPKRTKVDFQAWG
jgi:hypothetical protein